MDIAKYEDTYEIYQYLRATSRNPPITNMAAEQELLPQTS